MSPSPAGPGPAIGIVGSMLGLHPPGARADEPEVGVVQSRGRARFLVPLGSRRAAAASCLAYNRLRTRRTRLERAATGAALRVGASSIVTGQRLAIDGGPDSLLAHLRSTLEADDLHVAVGLGAVDTVWKPTLQVIGTDGEPRAYVKVGWTPFTTELVLNEAATLARWADHHGPGPVVPRLLATTTWRDLTLVAVAPLPPDVRRLADGVPMPRPMLVRSLDGRPTEAALGDTPWWQHLAGSVRAGCGRDSDRSLARAVDAAEARFGAATVTTGRWHGDWTPWNLADSPSRGLVAWDWEYSAAGAPVGLDELHSAFQVARLLRGRPVAHAFRRAGCTAADTLAAVHPLVVAERVQRAVRSGGALDAGGAETLAVAATASVEATRR